MKTEQPVLIASITATEDIANNLFVDVNGGISTNATLGVCNAETDQDEEAPVVVLGIALVLTGEAVTKGNPVSSDANGKCINGSGRVAGIALDASTGADELIRVLVNAVYYEI